MTEWTSDWPTVQGWYWFYGREHDSPAYPNKLTPVEVSGPVRNSLGGTSMVAVAGSSFLFQGMARGVWAPMELPLLPGAVESCDDRTRRLLASALEVAQAATSVAAEDADAMDAVFAVARMIRRRADEAEGRERMSLLCLADYLDPCDEAEDWGK